jgi:hypothetical protein
VTKAICKKKKDNKTWMISKVLVVKLERTDTTLDLSQEAKRSEAKDVGGDGKFIDDGNSDVGISTPL